MTPRSANRFMVLAAPPPFADTRRSSTKPVRMSPPTPGGLAVPTTLRAKVAMMLTKDTTMPWDEALAELLAKVGCCGPPPSFQRHGE